MIEVERLTAHERRVWEAFPRGRPVDLGGRIRAEVIAALLLGAVPVEPGHVAAVRLRNARITGRLDLRWARIAYPLELDNCVFAQAPDLREARARAITVTRSTLPSLRAHSLRAEGHLTLDRSRMTRLVLDEAVIDGNVSLTGVHLTNPRGLAFSADGLRITGELSMDQDFRASGEVRLIDASIDSQWILSKGRLENPTGVALQAYSTVVGGSVLGLGGLRLDGRVEMVGCRVGGDLQFDGVRLRGPNGVLEAERLAVQGDLYLRGARIDGGLLLSGATVGGLISLSGARVHGTVSAESMTVTGDLFADEGFHCDGSISLVDATVKGLLSLRGARLRGVRGAEDDPTYTCLDATRVTVGKSAYFDNVHAAGMIDLGNAKIENLLSMNGTVLEDWRTALSAERMAVTGSMTAVGLRAYGEVNLALAHVSGDLYIVGGSVLRDPRGTALNAVGLVVDGGLYLSGGLRAKGALNLIGARIGADLIAHDAYLDGGFAGDRMSVAGDLSFVDGFAEGGFTLSGATIRGLVRLSGTRLAATGGPALNADSVTVEGAFFADDDFRADGGVRLIDAHIKGVLSFRRARLTTRQSDNGSFISLDATRATVGKEAFLDGGFYAVGTVDLQGASIGSGLSLTDAVLEDWRVALNARGLRLAGDLVAMQLRAYGSLQLAAATIGGDLYVMRTTVISRADYAIAARGLAVTGALALGDRCTIDGGVELAQARIGDVLGLVGAELTSRFIALYAPRLTVGGDLILRAARVTGPIALNAAQIRGRLILSATSLAAPGGFAISGDSLVVDHDLMADEGFAADGAISLIDAQVKGVLSFRTARLTATRRYLGTFTCLDATRITVGKDAYLDGLYAVGTLILENGRIGKGLSLSAAVLEGGITAIEARALSVAGDVAAFAMRAYGAVVLPSAEVTGSVFLRDARIHGLTDLSGTTIGGRLQLSAAHLSTPRTSLVLDGESAVVAGDLEGADGFRADGAISLIDATIKGALWLSGARLKGARRGREYVCLDATRVTVGRGAAFNAGFYAVGALVLDDAQIASFLNLSDATLESWTTALSASGLLVKGALTAHGLRAYGEITLFNAEIDGDVYIIGGSTLRRPAGDALSGLELTVTGSMYLVGFSALGSVDLTRAEIGRNLLIGGSIGDIDLALLGRIVMSRGDLRRALTIGRLVLAGTKAGDTADLRGASVTLHEGTAFDLRGLSAGTLRLPPYEVAGGAIDLTDASLGQLEDRIPQSRDELPPVFLEGMEFTDLASAQAVHDRLRLLRAGAYHAQPYEQLAGYYRRLGNDPDARRVLLAKQRHRRKGRRMWAKPWGWLQDIAVGYGYRPLLAGGWLTLVLAVGTAYFTGNVPPPIDPAHAPEFNALAYSLDLLIPVIDLGQESAWNPSGVSQAVAYGLMLAGWLLATAVIAGLTRAITRS